ncbi:MAG: serine/threonine protein kinase, partial [Planctomycetes bacterium]|nr:serine/threonine protein kinase [Planctomycetota bacterium]
MATDRELDRRALELLDVLLELPAGQRKERLGELARDAALAQRVEALLRHSDAEDLTLPREPATIGPYDIEREIGRGGQGIVYLAHDARLGRRVALKVMTALGMLSDRSLARFRREAAIASKLDHPGICTVHEAGEAEGYVFITMRHVEGSSLAERIARVGAGEVGDGVARKVSTADAATAGTTQAEVMETVTLLEKAARALHHAHEAGVVHRDIKPGNILVTAAGEPVITDFGVARQFDDDATVLTHSGDVFGTPGYMSPEQLGGAGPVDRRTDVYSLGVTLFECLTGAPPFSAPTREGIYRQILTLEAPDPRSRNPAVSRDLATVVETAIDKDPDRRYRTALDFAEELRRVRQREPIAARRVTRLGRLVRWTQRNPWIATATAAAFLFLAVGLAVSLVLGNEARRTAGELIERTAEFELLALVTQLENTQARGERLPAAWPEHADVIQAWLDDEVGRLEAGLVRVRATLLRLRDAAMPSEAAREAARRRAAGFAELDEQRRRLELLRANAVVRERGPTAAPFELDPAISGKGVKELLQLAEPLIAPTREVTGRETEGLAMAELAMQKARPGERAQVGCSLALALHVLGRDDQAFAAIDAAEEAAASRHGRDQCRSIRTSIHRSITALPKATEFSARRITELEVDLVDWSFGDDTDAFLHATLTRFERECAAFLAADVAAVRLHLTWAARVRALTIDRYAERWAAAREVVTTSERYRAHPIDLRPQPGLVPLGCNPTTGLYEFYHLRSAVDLAAVAAGEVDPAELPIPEPGPDGTVTIGDDTGIVFVLVPGGT